MSKKKKLIALIVGVLVVAGVAVLFFMRNRQNKGENYPTYAVGLTEEEKQEVREIVEKYTSDTRDSMEDSDTRYGAISEEIVNVVPVAEAPNLETESEFIENMNSRGFSDVEFEAKISMDGEYDGKDVSSSSTEKHPLYHGYYVSKNNDIWQIYSAGGQVTAEPLSYELDTGQYIRIMYAESNEINCYDYKDNKIYTIVPKEDVTIVRVVDNVNAELLDSLTYDALAKLQ